MVKQSGQIVCGQVGEMVKQSAAIACGQVGEMEKRVGMYLQR